MRNLSILSYNIAGLKNKIDQVNFLNFVKGFEIFILIETHLEEKDVSLFEFHFKEYKLFWVYATRSSKFGRAKGGMLYAIKKLCWFTDLFEFVSVHNCNLIRCKLSGLEFYLCPVYININNWDSEFENIANLLNCYSEYKTVLMGDCNARVGELQIVPSEIVPPLQEIVSSRNSKDSIVNSNGRKILELCDNNNLIIMNGRTKGDREGEYTFIGGPGCSVNDLCCVHSDLLENMVD